MNATDAANEDTPGNNRQVYCSITPQMKTVMDYLAEYGEMTDEDLQELLNIKKTRAYLLSRQMNENGLIDIIGRGAGKKISIEVRAKMMIATTKSKNSIYTTNTATRNSRLS